MKIKKMYSDYNEMRKSIIEGIYNLLMDSIGQINGYPDGYSTDITIRQYDEGLCIDYDVYRKLEDDGQRYLDGGKVCIAADMPASEEAFWNLVKEKIDKHLNTYVKES